MFTQYKTSKDVCLLWAVILSDVFVEEYGNIRSIYGSPEPWKPAKLTSLVDKEKTKSSFCVRFPQGQFTFGWTLTEVRLV
jgi:hypothetical protein